MIRSLTTIIGLVVLIFFCVLAGAYAFNQYTNTHWTELKFNDSNWGENLGDHITPINQTYVIFKGGIVIYNNSTQKFEAFQEKPIGLTCLFDEKIGINVNGTDLFVGCVKK